MKELRERISGHIREAEKDFHRMENEMADHEKTLSEHSVILGQHETRLNAAEQGIKKNEALIWKVISALSVSAAGATLGGKFLLKFFQ